jgi:hypothetical protein
MRIRIRIQQLKLMRIHADPDLDTDPDPKPWELVAGLLRPRLFPFGKLSKLKSAAQLFLLDEDLEPEPDQYRTDGSGFGRPKAYGSYGSGFGSGSQTLQKRGTTVPLGTSVGKCSTQCS